MAHLSTIDELNAATPLAFTQTLHILFESAPQLSSQLLLFRPFPSYKDLLETASSLINKLPVQDKIEIVNAHPRIGADKNTLSLLSHSEQGYTSTIVGEEEDDVLIHELLNQLNEAYEEKFGFKFVIFVNGRSRKSLIPEFKKRLLNEGDDELERGLCEMMQIAHDRLNKLSS
jgi:2-oxo-4-hydroxy-4-carboxy--5-ureidoimidazoline (OHCU) decarboxylase